MKKLRLATVSLLVSIAFSGCSPSEESAGYDGSATTLTADWILTGGKIYTVDTAQPWADTIAIKDNRFIFVGTASAAEAYAAESTRRTDLDGQFVMPGMIDGHTHPGYINVEQYGDPLPTTGHDDLLDAIGRYADDNPDTEWIRLCCWSNSDYISGASGPHKSALDSVVPDRPVWITSAGWHSYWLNSKALQELGIDKNTPNPRAGIATYVRDEFGEPTGWVKEGAGWQHLAKIFPVDAAAQTASIDAFLETLLAHGVTTVYDAGNFEYGDHVYGHLAELDRRGDLQLRYEGTTAIYLPEQRHTAIEELRRLRAAHQGDKLAFNTVKLFMDGITENRSGAMLEPYSDDPDYVGRTLLTKDELVELLVDLHEARLDLHVHAIADLAVRTTLDAVEVARTTVGADWHPRVTIGHLEIIDPADWSRFAELDVSANYTAWWLGENYNPTVSEAFGPERSLRTYTAGSLFDVGANVTFSSDDWRLAPLSPFLGMQIAHNRQDPEEWLAARQGSMDNIRPPQSEQLDLAQLVKGYTLNGAHPFRLEDQIGSIEVGKMADFVVLEEDLFEVNNYAIEKTKPVAVVMEGDLVSGEIN